MADYRAPRRLEDEPLVPRKISLTVAENEAINRVLADQGIGLSELTRDLILSPARRMSSADARRVASELMQVRESMNRLLLLVMKEGAPADEEFVERIEDLNIRLFNLTEEVVIR